MLNYETEIKKLSSIQLSDEKRRVAELSKTYHERGMFYECDKALTISNKYRALFNACAKEQKARI